jgi:adenylate cyclase
MLEISVANDAQNESVKHASGPIVLGRVPQQGGAQLVIRDDYTSRTHLRAEELPDGRVRLENLSRTSAITLDDGTKIRVGGWKDLNPPINFTMGTTNILITQLRDSRELDQTLLHTIGQPITGMGMVQEFLDANALSASPPPEELARWLEMVLSLFRACPSLDEIYNKTAEALVRMVGLDLGLVLQRQGENWLIAASHRESENTEIRFSRTLVQYVAEQQRTFYQDWSSLHEIGGSVRYISAAVVSPILGLNEEVSAVLYGVRGLAGSRAAQPIGLLEAQVVQLLAAAAGLSLTRAVAARTRIQFEQFFSPELVRELERNPNLLEGRSQEVTILVSDMRGFTTLSEQLGPQVTFQVVRDLMEHLSGHIIQAGGVIVDYAGDGILAMWNAPVEQDQHAHRACRAALAMLQEMPAVNEKWQATVGRPLAIGIGINTGPALVGNTGSTCKFKYGPNGYTVNLTSRVQEATKKLGVPILLTAATRELLSPQFIISPAGPMQLPGVAEELPLYELHGEIHPDIWSAGETVPPRSRKA